MDLQTISSQMKIVIQKHQMVVTEMRNDPQNPVLQKQLHDLQSEILSLNERQKQIVEDLRKNFGKKPCCPNSSANNSSGFSTSVHSSLHQISNQDMKMICNPQKSPPMNHKIPTTTHACKPIPNSLSTVRQPVPPSLNSISTPSATAAFTFKAPVGTVVLPNCSTGNALLSPKTAATSDHQKVHPVLVVPSPSSRSADGAQTGVLLNLVPPIRVPQYPPPSPRATVPQPSQKPQQTLNNCIPVTSTTPVTAFVSSQSSSSYSEQPLNFANIDFSANSSEKQHSQSSDKMVNKIDQKKKEFFTALGLVTRDSLCDIKNKKLERKRRSTANPQFSNAALEEKWKNAAAAQALAAPQKRPRGRPRLESKSNICPSNGICSLVEAAKSIESYCVNDTANSTAVSISSTPNTFINCTSTVVNGIHKQPTGTVEGKNVEQMLSGLCIVCTQPGDLVKCDTCAKQQHLGCMQPPLVTRPQGPWRCTDCQSRSDSLTVVQSYDLLKAAKEDERRKLLKKSLELRLKRSQLESRLLQLKEASGVQKNQHSELETSLKDTKNLLERFYNLVHSVQLCS